MVRGGREVQEGREHMRTYDRFMLMYGKNQCNIGKKVSLQLKISKSKKQAKITNYYKLGNKWRQLLSLHRNLICGF